MNTPRILVFGAGPLGSVLAARLHQAGWDVAVAARGERLEQIRDHGIILHDVITDRTTTDMLPSVEQLGADDFYDLVLVVMGRNHVLASLPMLARSRRVKTFLFLGNNAAGPGLLIDALGADRVLTGFPNAAGYFEGPVVHCIAGQESDPSTIPFGEVDGTIKPRTRRVAKILDSMPGYSADIQTHMDDWLKTHVALLFPTLAPALRACGMDRLQMVNTRDAMLLYIRSLRESFQVLRSQGIRILPGRLRRMSLLPEPVLLVILKRMLSHELMETALDRHAEAAQAEIKQLQWEFRLLVDQSGISTPSLDRLSAMADAGETFPPGSKSLRMRLF